MTETSNQKDLNSKDKLLAQVTERSRKCFRTVNVQGLVSPCLTDRQFLCVWFILAPDVGEGNGTPFQYSCLENPRDGGAWWAAIYGVAQSQTRLKRLSSSSTWCDGPQSSRLQSLPVILWLAGPDHILVGIEGVGIHGTRNRYIDHEGEVVPTERK